MESHLLISTQSNHDLPWHLLEREGVTVVDVGEKLFVCLLVAGGFGEVKAHESDEILFRNGNLTLALAGWWRRLGAGSGVWGFWAGPGLVWMGCGVFAVALLWGGRLLEAGHQSSTAVSRCW